MGLRVSFQIPTTPAARSMQAPELCSPTLLLSRLEKGSSPPCFVLQHCWDQAPTFKQEHRKPKNKKTTKYRALESWKDSVFSGAHLLICRVLRRKRTSRKCPDPALGPS